MKAITVLLADDHLMVREALCMLLNCDSAIDVVGQTDNGRGAVQLSALLKPRVIAMDLGMPSLNGMEATRQILKAQPESRILMLSAHNDTAYEEKAAALGSYGYLIKQGTGIHLIEAIKRADRGLKSFISEKNNLQDQTRVYTNNRVGCGFDRCRVTLTSRETEILKLIAEGNANKESATHLHISIKTVEKHRQSLMNKLNIHETAGLTRHAIACGVIKID